MKLRRWLWAAPIVGAVGIGIVVNSVVSADVVKKDVDPKQVVNLPITQVVLFNSGVGYFGRSGEVDGEARVDLQFPETDINDLLKSMTLQDFNGGQISAVSYDSREPVSRTLGSFAINLNNEPTLANILNQARGEKVEVVMNTTVTTQPGTLQGTVVGIESQKVPVGTAQIDCTMLNLSTAEGLRSLKMMDVQRVRFVNPVLEAELKRALDTLARSHDAQKKAVSVQFSGEGRRKVKVGYVIEAPIWKTSYRLVLDKEAKPYLQGWAVVENPTDEDWTGVKMALVSGRPISFKMDLYNPLFVPRPTVEPELFASLRPQSYDGGVVTGWSGDQAKSREERTKIESYTKELKEKKDRQESLAVRTESRVDQARKLGAAREQFTLNGLNDAEMMKKSVEALEMDDPVAVNLGKRMDVSGIQSAASASKLGDYFQYVIKHPVALARQKSAMLPIVGEDIEGTRVSIYNSAVQAKHPLLGVRFKNTTKSHLSQGPVTVIEGSTYAGDGRIQDVQPNDERLLAYAIDLGTEVIPQSGDGKNDVTKVSAKKGIVHVTRRQREVQVYKVSNKSDAERTLLIEHPNRTNQQFKLVETAKPVEETAALFRFELKVAAGKSAEFKVTEERDLGEQMYLTNTNDDGIRFLLSLSQSSPELKANLAEVTKKKAAWETVQRELQQVTADLARITADQDRIRKNLRETPKEAEVYGVYLKKLSEQEKEIDGLITKQKKLTSDEATARKGYEEFLLTVAG